MIARQKIPPKSAIARSPPNADPASVEDPSTVGVVVDVGDVGVSTGAVVLVGCIAEGARVAIGFGVQVGMGLGVHVGTRRGVFVG